MKELKIEVNEKEIIDKVVKEIALKNADSLSHHLFGLSSVKERADKLIKSGEFDKEISKHIITQIKKVNYKNIVKEIVAEKLKGDDY